LDQILPEKAKFYKNVKAKEAKDQKVIVGDSFESCEILFENKREHAHDRQNIIKQPGK
jgi:hypothetical protein